MSNRAMVLESNDVIRENAVVLLKDNTITAHVFRMVGHVLCHVTNAIDAIQAQLDNHSQGVDHCRRLTAKHTAAIHKTAARVVEDSKAIERLHEDDNSVDMALHELKSDIEKLYGYVAVLQNRGRDNDGGNGPAPLVGKEGFIAGLPKGLGKTGAFFANSWNPDDLTYEEMIAKTKQANRPPQLIDEVAVMPANQYDRFRKILDDAAKVNRQKAYFERAKKCIPIILEMVEAELLNAAEKHAPQNSLHESYSVILEEVDELWDEVKKKSSERKSGEVGAEFVQIAAMGVRGLVDLYAKEVLGEKAWVDPPKTITRMQPETDNQSMSPAMSQAIHGGPVGQKVGEAMLTEDERRLAKTIRLAQGYEAGPQKLMDSVRAMEATSAYVNQDGPEFSDGPEFVGYAQRAGEASWSLTKMPVIFGPELDTDNIQFGRDRVTLTEILEAVGRARTPAPENRSVGMSKALGAAYGAKGCGCAGCTATGQDDLPKV